MYSWTWASTEAFDRHIARKYRTYRYTAELSGDAVDITNRLSALPGAVDALTGAIDRSRQGADRNGERIGVLDLSTGTFVPAARRLE
jgi:hypothetical protein